MSVVQIRRISIGVVLLSIISALSAPSAAFNGNCQFNHCYSVKRAGTFSATGTIITQNNNSLTPGSSSVVPQRFFNSETWLVGANGSWVEAGISNGYNFTLGSWAYSYFTYSRNTVTNVDSGWIYLKYAVPDGTTHSFQVSRAASTNRFSVWIDGTSHAPNWISGDVSFWQGQPQVGGELYTASANAHADTFDIYTRMVTSTGVITQWPASGSTFAITSGFNGVNHGTFWSWNAP